MAATDRASRRLGRRRRRLERKLPWLAAGFGALAVRDARGQSSVDTRFLFYKESGGRTQVLDPVILLNQDFGEAYGQVGLLLGYDIGIGAPDQRG